MDKTKQAKLEASGWVVGTPKALLNLSFEDEVFINIKTDLAATFRKQRLDQELSQVVVARRLHSSQSRVAKMEAADPSVTVDLLIRSILRLGGTRETVAAALDR